MGKRRPSLMPAIAPLIGAVPVEQANAAADRVLADYQALTARAREIAAGLTGPQGALLLGTVAQDMGYGGRAPVARRLAALGLVEEPTNIAPLRLVVTDLGRAVAAVLAEVP